MDPLMITAADPLKLGLSILTRRKLAQNEEKADRRKERALQAASKMLDPEQRRAAPVAPSRRLDLGLLLAVGCLFACEPVPGPGPVPAPADAAASRDLPAADLGAPDLSAPRVCTELSPEECLLCGTGLDPAPDCRPLAPPACLACSWTETLNCLPSLCAEFRFGTKCCATSARQ